jgi:two-component system response regulator AtoC
MLASGPARVNRVTGRRNSCSNRGLIIIVATSSDMSRQRCQPSEALRQPSEEPMTSPTRRPPLRRPDLPLVDFHGMKTVSPLMLRFFELLRRVARSEAAVLFRGESGTGKELAARALHALSPRGKRPVRAVNCATLTGEMLASELFGHVRGAFTGAIKDRKGLFVLADGGSIFLDEIAEVPLEIQAQLLRVLQEKRFYPLGGSDPVAVDVRVLSATHVALRDAVSRGRFREDLMYRVRVVPLFLPRLADREGDVEALLWHFIDEGNRAAASHGLRTIEAVDRDAMDALLAYSWPGNVRELHNVVQYALAVGDGPVLQTDELTPELRGEPPPGHEDEVPRTEAEMEREQLMRALQRSRGSRTEAAKLLGISRSTLWRRLREHGIA